jgi:hypothetical protein
MTGIYKRDLLALESPNYNVAAAPGVSADGKSIEYFIGAHTAGIDGYQLFVLRIYQNENDGGRQLRYSVFIDFIENSFLDYDHLTNKWREAVIENLLGWQGWYYKAIAYIDDYSRKLAGLLQNEPDRDTLDVVSDWQSNIRDKSLQARTARERRKIDSIMEQAAPLPDDIYRYIDDVVMRDHRYSYYKRSGNKINAFCTYCHRDYTLTAPVGTLVGKCGVCPLCGSVVQYKAVGAAKDIFVRENFSFACRVSDGILVTRYGIQRIFSRKNDNEYYFRKSQQPNIYQETRIFTSLSGVSSSWIWEWRSRKFEQGSQWYADRNVFIQCPLYPDNLAEIIAGTHWQYSALDAYARGVKHCDAAAYLSRVQWMPVLEKMVKVGLFRLVADQVNGNVTVCSQNRYDLRLSLELNMDEIHLLAEVNASADEYLLYKKYREIGVRLTAEEILRVRALDIARYLRDEKILIENATPGKIIGYVETQYALDTAKEHPQYRDANYLIFDWRDYLLDCQLLGYDWRGDKRIMFPRDVGEAHIGTSLKVKIAETSKYDEAFGRSAPELEKLYAWQDGGYLVRPARNAAELVVEGDTLGHCVARYAERMARGETVILFVRSASAPDMPLATAEVKDNRVVQIRSFKNHDPDESILKFWEKYKHEILENISLEGGSKLAREGHRNEQRIRVGA